MYIFNNADHCLTGPFPDRDGFNYNLHLHLGLTFTSYIFWHADPSVTHFHPQNHIISQKSSPTEQIKAKMYWERLNRK